MSIIDILKTGNRRDVMGFWDKDYRQVFERSRPMNCRVMESSKNFEHPIETGAVIIDHRIIMPVQIEVSLVMDGAFYYDQYLKIKKAFLNADLFYVHTRTGIYDNMMIVDMPHEENPAQFDTISVGIKLTEVQFVEAQFLPLPPQKVKTATNQSTKDKGISNAKTVEAPKVRQSQASKWFG